MTPTQKAYNDVYRAIEKLRRELTVVGNVSSKPGRYAEQVSATLLDCMRNAPQGCDTNTARIIGTLACHRLGLIPPQFTEAALAGGNQEAPAEPEQKLELQAAA